MTTPEILIRQANVTDAVALRELRLEALQNTQSESQVIHYAGKYYDELLMSRDV